MRCGRCCGDVGRRVTVLRGSGCRERSGRSGGNRARVMVRQLRHVRRQMRVVMMVVVRVRTTGRRPTSRNSGPAAVHLVDVVARARRSTSRMLHLLVEFLVIVVQRTKDVGHVERS